MRVNSESCALITSPVTAKSKTGRVARNQPQVIQNLRSHLMRVDSSMLTLLATSPPPLARGDPSAAVPIEFVVAAARRDATPPSPCRSLLVRTTRTLFEQSVMEH